MKRILFLLIALLGPVAAFAQTTIYVSVTYTPGAALAAGGASTLTTAVQTRINAINAAYTASGINIALSATVSAAGSSAPNDLHSQADQFYWVKNNPAAWDARGSTGSIAIHISDTSGATGAMISSTQPADVWNSVAAVPWAALDPSMEAAISRIIGASPTGYSKRAVLLPGDPNNSGVASPYCYRTREAAPTDTSEVVPIPAHWSVGSAQSSQTWATLQANACEAQRLISITLNACGGVGNPGCAKSAIATATGSPPMTGTCYLNQANDAPFTNFTMAYTLQATGSTVTCTDTVLGYSKNGNMAAAPFLPLGSPGIDSVGVMNGRISAVSNFGGASPGIAKSLKGGIWKSVCFYLGCD